MQQLISLLACCRYRCAQKRCNSRDWERQRHHIFCCGQMPGSAHHGGQGPELQNHKERCIHLYLMAALVRMQQVSVANCWRDHCTVVCLCLMQLLSCIKPKAVACAPLRGAHHLFCMLTMTTVPITCNNVDVQYECMLSFMLLMLQKPALTTHCQ